MARGSLGLARSLVLLIVAATSVAAHGKVALVVGDLGGNGTALAIRGGVVPGDGPNRKTEVDTTVFEVEEAMTNGLGRTQAGGAVHVADLKRAMALSGGVLPQVSSTGGVISGTFHVVTTDGAGPLRAILDPTATGAFSEGTELQVLQQVPGNEGTMRRNGRVPRLRNGARSLARRAGLLSKRAANVNLDFPMSFAVPTGTSCQGTVEGIRNVCLVKIANSNAAGPFGGIVAIQVPQAGAKAGNVTPPLQRPKFSRRHPSGVNSEPAPPRTEWPAYFTLDPLT